MDASAMDDNDTKARTREFLARFIRHHDLGDDEDIFALGFVNSLFAMELVMFVEKTFGVAIDRDDLELDNFRTVNAIAGLVRRKGEAGAQVSC